MTPSIYGSAVRPSRPHFHWYFEGRSIDVSLEVYARNRPIATDTLIEVGLRCEVPSRLATFLDWLLPDRRFSDPNSNKGWCAGRA